MAVISRSWTPDIIKGDAATLNSANTFAKSEDAKKLIAAKQYANSGDKATEEALKVYAQKESERAVKQASKELSEAAAIGQSYTDKRDAQVRNYADNRVNALNTELSNNLDTLEVLLRQEINHARVENRQAGDVGTSVFAFVGRVPRVVSFGTVINGEDIVPAGIGQVAGQAGDPYAKLSGSWMCLGYAKPFADNSSMRLLTEYVRIT